MNTITRLLALGSAILLCSCIKEADKDNETVNTEVIIHATMAQDGDTKTVLQENGSVFWQPGDQIAVFFNSVKVPFTSYNSVDAASAYFVGNMDITAGHNEGSDGAMAGEYVFWGLYPLYSMPDYYMLYKSNDSFYVDNNPQLYYDKSYGYNPYDFAQTPYYSFASCDGEKVSTLSPYWQKGAADSFDKDLNLALAKSDDYHELSFYNILGGVRFSVQSSDITRVTFRGNNHESLAGEFQVRMGDDDRPMITEVTKAFETVTVSLEDNQPFTPGVWYYIMLFPKVLSQGYIMEFYKADVKAQKVMNRSTEIKRSVFGSLENADAGLSFDTEVIYPSDLAISSEDGSSSYYDTYVTIGQEIQLTAVPQPENCTFSAVWRSEDPSIASVSKEGRVKGLSKGSTHVHCFVDNKESSVIIRVLGEDECYALSIITPDGFEGYEGHYPGEQIQFAAVPTPSGCTGTVVWESSDETVATVDQNGLATIVGEGDCSIRASIGNTYSDSVYLMVRGQSIDGVYGLDDGRTAYLTNALVYATGSRSFVVGDEDARYFLHIYHNSSDYSHIKKGDIVTILGQKTTFGGIAEVNDIQTIQVQSSGNALSDFDYKPLEYVYKKTRERIVPVYAEGIVCQRSNAAYTFNYLYPMEGDESAYSALYLYWPDAAYTNLGTKYISIKGFWLFRDDSVTDSNNALDNVLICEAEEADAPYTSTTIQGVIGGTDDSLYMVTGTVSEIVDAANGLLYISDESADQALYLDGLRNFCDFSYNAPVNSIITVMGKRTTSNNSIRLSNAILIRITNP